MWVGVWVRGCAGRGVGMCLGEGCVGGCVGEGCVGRCVDEGVCG